MIINQPNWAVRIATLNLPVKTKMPGTIGSGVVWVYLNGICVINLLSNIYPDLKLINLDRYNLFVPVIACLIAWPVINTALKYFNQKDPALICLDEVVGMLASMCLVPINFMTVFFSLLLFRFFDILKPLGIKKVEQLPGAWGVLLDDVLAGIYANLSLRVFVWLFAQYYTFFE
jgi:phosphatidylglycerophosphatase A